MPAGSTNGAAAAGAEAAPTHAAPRGGSGDDECMDEFKLVTRRRRGQAAKTSGDGGGGTGAAASPCRGKEGDGDLGADVDGDDCMDGGAAEVAQEELDERQGADLGAEDEPPSHQTLWTELQAARDELRFMRRKWGDEHWAVCAAVERVEALDAAWRQEKPEGLLSRKHLRAEQAVRKGDARVAQVIEEIQALEDDYNARREQLEGRLADERCKVRELRAKLDQVRAEVGAEHVHGGGCAAAANGAQEQADRMAMLATVQCLQDEVGPSLQAMSEALDASGVAEDVRQQLQAVTSKLHAVYGTLQQRTELAEARREDGCRYHIGDGEESELPELTERERLQASADWYSGQFGYAHGDGGWGTGAQWSQWYHAPHYGGHHGGYGGGQWAWHRGGGEYDSDPVEPRSKKGKTHTDAMDVQDPADMHLPPPQGAEADSEGAQSHMQQPRAAEEADAYRAQRAAFTARAAEVRELARERGVDMADVDFEVITPAQLEAIARERLAPRAEA